MKNSLKENANKGFTLVEMCVALALAAILVGVSAFGIIKWTAYSEYRRQNEYAQTLYLAARNTFVRLRSDNVLDEFIGQYACDTGYDGTLSYHCKFGPESTIYPPSSYSKPVCYAYCNSGDYRKYTGGMPLTGEDAEIVFRLLEDAVYDKSVLDGCISIEYSPTDGMVYAVLFSDRAESFTYSLQTTGDSRLNLKERGEDERYELSLGYYSVAD